MIVRKIFSSKAKNLQWFYQRRHNVYSTNLTPVTLTYRLFENSGTDKTATPLIIMHGLLGSKQNWRSVGMKLETELRKKIYAVDLRNHGESPHTEEHTSAHMAADIVELMRQHGIPKADIMGHSMGGRTAMFLALKHPELVNRLIVLDISPVSLPRSFTHMEGILSAMEKVSVPSELTFGKGRRLAESQINEAVGDNTTVAFIMTNFRKRPTGEFYWLPNVKSLHKNLRNFSTFMQHLQDSPPYTGPTMFVCGNYSNYVDPDTWPSIQAIFPNSELHWLDCGHLVHIEKPEEFIQLVVNFLKK